MNLTQIIERTLFWWRTRQKARELNFDLAVRRRIRAERSAAARKGARTRFHNNMEGLRR